jgi:hypothetical protein
MYIFIFIPQPHESDLKISTKKNDLAQILILIEAFIFACIITEDWFVDVHHKVSIKITWDWFGKFQNSEHIFMTSYCTHLNTKALKVHQITARRLCVCVCLLALLLLLLLLFLFNVQCPCRISMPVEKEKNPDPDPDPAHWCWRAKL